MSCALSVDQVLYDATLDLEWAVREPKDRDPNSQPPAPLFDDADLVAGGRARGPQLLASSAMSEDIQQEAYVLVDLPPVPKPSVGAARSVRGAGAGFGTSIAAADLKPLSTVFPALPKPIPTTAPAGNLESVSVERSVSDGDQAAVHSSVMLELPLAGPSSQREGAVSASSTPLSQLHVRVPIPRLRILIMAVGTR